MVNGSSWTEVLSSFGENGAQKVAESWDWLAFKSGLGRQCEFVPHPSITVREHLHKNLVGQEDSVEAIAQAIESWEFSFTTAKDHAPMVLAITGPTGTGKTKTATLIAEALFQRRRKLENSIKYEPTGLIVFSGQDFNDVTKNPVTEHQEQIKSRLVEHLSTCSGKAVVVFDEVQKVVPQTLDVLIPAMSENALLTYYKNGVERKVDCSNVIPYLPLEQTHIVNIISLKLKQFNELYKGKRWFDLVIEPGVAEYMSRLASIQYQSHHAVFNGKKINKVFAKYGAREVNHGPLHQLKSILSRFLRPWNPRTVIMVSYISSSEEIEITACGVKNGAEDNVCSERVRKWKGALK
ncbi:hypothetical protein THRCLA_20940 [Thraustotheca clavata]|uniref:AAA+ ATPase domain-containing protein n=1 Tax=Thraustotheca clavata TaxID=74557 RepID=A0A1W0A1S8_9STRA|nr:hypothetical protein THRCLA_20940 [Thraustotheca clavata]